MNCPFVNCSKLFPYWQNSFGLSQSNNFQILKEIYLFFKIIHFVRSEKKKSHAMHILLTTPSNVLPLHPEQTFPSIIWIFNEGKGDENKSRLPFTIFFTLHRPNQQFHNQFLFTSTLKKKVFHNQYGFHSKNNFLEIFVRKKLAILNHFVMS